MKYFNNKGKVFESRLHCEISNITDTIYSATHNIANIILNTIDKITANKKDENISNRNTKIITILDNDRKKGEVNEISISKKSFEDDKQEKNVNDDKKDETDEVSTTDKPKVSIEIAGDELILKDSNNKILETSPIEDILKTKPIEV